MARIPSVDGGLHRTAMPSITIRNEVDWLEDVMSVGESDGSKSESFDETRKQMTDRLHQSTKLKFRSPRHRGRSLPMHSLLSRWCEKHIKKTAGGVHAKREIALLVVQFLRQGFFSFNTERVRRVVGDAAYKCMKEFASECPYVRQTHKAIPGVRSSRYVFVLPGITFNSHIPIHSEHCTDQLVDGYHPTVNGVRCGRIDRQWLELGVVPGDWLLCRAAKWHLIALAEGWMVGLDSFGTNFSGGVHHAFASLSVDKALDIRCRADVPCGVRECAKCEHASAYHSKLVNRSLTRCVILIRGRLYHAFSSCPKLIRGQLLLDGERLGEVDISASYLCALTSQLWEDTATQRRQKDQLIHLQQTGEFFERIADECGYAWTDRGELKRQFNMQCLFWREKTPESARPLWSGLSRLFPNLARLIMGVRRCSGGASGLSDWLCWRESHTMFAIFDAVGKAGIKFLPNHDGILIAQSNVPEVREIAIRVATKVLGFEPAVKVKYTH